jgi:hemerythrin superfamily protein
MTSYASSGSSSSSASSSCATMTSSCSGTSSAPAMAGSEAPDVVGVIKLDHAHVMNLFKEYEGLRGKADTCSNERRECVAYEIVRQISIHSAAEELVVYPAFSERMTDQTAAKKIYDASIADHQHLK